LICNRGLFLKENGLAARFNSGGGREASLNLATLSGQ
jgi:hypothetical protein